MFSYSVLILHKVYLSLITTQEKVTATAVLQARELKSRAACEQPSRPACSCMHTLTQPTLAILAHLPISALTSLQGAVPLHQKPGQVSPHTKENLHISARLLGSHVPFHLPLVLLLPRLLYSSHKGLQVTQPNE